MFEQMNVETKITLSSKELELVCNTDWILTKHTIISKAYELFGQQALLMQRVVAEGMLHLPVEISLHGPKISRGENYSSLPYVILDYPRCFEKDKTFAIRTMFWWGNFFSINLQLSGIYKETLLPALLTNFYFLQEKGYSVCISGDPWKHHFGEDNYLPLQKCAKEGFAIILNRESFVKIGKTLPLQQWNTATTFIETSFLEITTLLKH
jgi:hypothetical protein